MPACFHGGMPITVVPATPDRLEAVEGILGRTECWCAYYRQRSGDYSRGREETTSDAIARRRRLLLDALGGDLAPGVLALEEDRPIGWCGLGYRSGLERIVRSRTIPSVDDRDPVSIVCFLTAAGHRRRGVASSLLAGAVRYALDVGVPVLEGYPVDARGALVNSADAHVGTVSMFEAHGFRRVRETDSKAGGLNRWLVRLEL